MKRFLIGMLIGVIVILGLGIFQTTFNIYIPTVTLIIIATTITFIACSLLNTLLDGRRKKQATS